MPLYEYECTQCHKRTEKIQKFSDAELTICPHCGGPLERTITAPAVHFAGGGWYKDGYGSAKPAAAAEGGSAPAAEGGSADSTPAGAAPAATPAATPATSAAPAPSAAPAAPATPAKT